MYMYTKSPNFWTFPWIEFEIIRKDNFVCGCIFDLWPTENRNFDYTRFNTVTINKKSYTHIAISAL